MCVCVCVCVRVRVCVCCTCEQLGAVCSHSGRGIHLVPFTSQLSNTHSHFLTHTHTQSHAHSIMSPVTLIPAVHRGPVSEPSMSKSSRFAALTRLLTSPVNLILSSSRKRQPARRNSRQRLGGWAEARTSRWIDG